MDIRSLVRRAIESRTLIVVLGLAAVVQLGLLISRWASPNDATRSTRSAASGVQIGDSLREISGSDAEGSPVRIDLVTRGTPTVVLAFHSGCRFCEDVAPLWKSWLDDHPASRVVLVTRDAPEKAVAYAERHGWRGTILSVVSTTTLSVERYLVSRTPWLFVFDEDGVLRINTHGARIESATSLSQAAR